MVLPSKGLPRATADIRRQLTEIDGKTAAITPVTTPDGSDADTTQTLANALKAKINQLIAALNA